MDKILLSKTGKLQVPEHPVIPFIEGDGVGAEITPATQSIMHAVVHKAYKGARSIAWKEVLAGEKAFRTTGSWLPDDTMQAFREYRVGIKGPLTTPVGGGIRSLNVALRQELDLFVCLRPVRWFRGVASPLKEPSLVDMYVFRENTEDIYAGIEWEQGTPQAARVLDFLTREMGVTKIRFPETSAFGVKPVSRQGSQRLVRAAIEYALLKKHPSVTLVHKGNIMKFTEGGFKNWGYELAEEAFSGQVFTMNQYQRIKEQKGKVQADAALEEAKSSGLLLIQDVIADAFLQNTLLRPRDYSVIATLNLNGDYISDQLAAMVGGIGIAPGANINYLSGHALFEATHGTAPDIAGKNQVNPCSLLLSGAMMLEYLGWSEASHLIHTTLESLFEDGYATHDLARFMPNGTSLSTTEFRDKVLERVAML